MMENKDLLQENDLQNNFINEINDENAQDAEDRDNQTRHEIPMLDYEAMDMEQLIKEFSLLISRQKIQVIKKQVDAIKISFDKKNELIKDEKKTKILRRRWARI